MCFISQFLTENKIMQPEQYLKPCLFIAVSTCKGTDLLYIINGGWKKEKRIYNYNLLSFIA